MSRAATTASASRSRRAPCIDRRPDRRRRRGRARLPRRVRHRRPPAARQGAQLAQVRSGTPAANAGLQAGDVDHSGRRRHGLFGLGAPGGDRREEAGRPRDRRLSPQRRRRTRHRDPGHQTVLTGREETPRWIDDTHTRDETTLTRRDSLLGLGGIAAAALGAGGVLAALDGDDAEAASSGPAAVTSGLVTCVLTPEMTEGPYYLDGDKVRRDIREGRPGTRLDLATTVVDVSTVQADQGRCRRHLALRRGRARTPASRRRGPTGRRSCGASSGRRRPGSRRSSPSIRAGTRAAPSISTSRCRSAGTCCTRAALLPGGAHGRRLPPRAVQPAADPRHAERDRFDLPERWARSRCCELAKSGSGLRRAHHDGQSAARRNCGPTGGGAAEPSPPPPSPVHSPRPRIASPDRDAWRSTPPRGLRLDREPPAAERTSPRSSTRRTAATAASRPDLSPTSIRRSPVSRPRSTASAWPAVERPGAHGRRRRGRVHDHECREAVHVRARLRRPRAGRDPAAGRRQRDRPPVRLARGGRAGRGRPHEPDGQPRRDRDCEPRPRSARRTRSGGSSATGSRASPAARSRSTRRPSSRRRRPTDRTASSPGSLARRGGLGCDPARRARRLHAAELPRGHRARSCRDGRDARRRRREPGHRRAGRLGGHLPVRARR